MPIKLFVDCHAFDHDLRQGITTYLAGLYQQAIQLDSGIDFWFAARHPEKLTALFGQGANVHYLSYRSDSKYWRLGFELPAILREGKFDYAHYQYISPAVKQCCEIVTLHDVLFRDFPEQFNLGYRLSKSLLFGRSARRADILLTVSDYSRRRIAHHFGIPESRIGITPNAVNSDLAAMPRSTSLPGETAKLSRYILFVSRIEPRKNHLLLLRCYRELRLWEQGIGLVCVGAPALSCRELESEKQQLPAAAAGMVHWLTQVSLPELCALYAKATLFVFPSLSEGFGIPPLEAAMFGTQVLCSDRTAMADFDFFGNGLFNPEQPGVLKQKLADYFAGQLRLPDPQLLQSTIQNRYSWQGAAQTLLDAIHHHSQAKTAAKGDI